MNTIRKKIGVLLIGIGFAILVGACSTKESPTTIPVWNASYSNQIRLSAYFDTVEYVFLQDHPEGHFITVDKIVFAFERWYILDKNLMSILCFTSEGGFLFKIQSVGKGPGEYALLSSFFIDSTKREIWAHCRMPGKFIVYDEFGTFIREEPCARGGQDMIQTNDGRILMFNMYPYERSNKRLEAGIFYAAENIRDINQIQDFPSGTAYYSSDSRKNQPYGTIG